MKSDIVTIAILYHFLTLGHLQAQSFLNGDFESGNTGFTSDYQFAEANSTEGQFTVRSDPQHWNGAFVKFGDHTTGSGQMLVVNGATSGNPSIWRQTVTLATNTTYRFRAWTGTAVSGGPANLILKINGSQIGPSFVLPDTSGSWVQWEQPWTSTVAAEYTFEIINANTSVFPNDFYVDDIGIFPVPLALTASTLSGVLSLSWPADPAWGLFSSNTLVADSWIPVTTSPTTEFGMSTLVLPINEPRAFFRLQVVR